VQLNNSWIILGSALLIQAPAIDESFATIESETQQSGFESNNLGMRAQKESPITHKTSDYLAFIHKSVHEALPKKYHLQARQVANSIIHEANFHNMDPLLVVALVHHESKFNPEAMGSHGEIGLMQIKPTTAKWLSQEVPSIGTLSDDLDKLAQQLHDPVTNIKIGTAYLAHLKSHFGGRSRLYLSAYNMGAKKVHLRIKERSEPRKYADQIFERYSVLVSSMFTGDTHLRGMRTINRTPKWSLDVSPSGALPLVTSI
jgi:soluble lytic murein transglycosylase-like protein